MKHIIDVINASACFFTLGAHDKWMKVVELLSS